MKKFTKHALVTLGLMMTFFIPINVESFSLGDRSEEIANGRYRSSIRVYGHVGNRYPRYSQHSRFYRPHNYYRQSRVYRYPRPYNYYDNGYYYNRSRHHHSRGVGVHFYLGR